MREVIRIVQQLYEVEKRAGVVFLNGGRFECDKVVRSVFRLWRMVDHTILSFTWPKRCHRILPCAARN
jgi:hypothetical protein